MDQPTDFIKRMTEALQDFVTSTSPLDRQIALAAMERTLAEHYGAGQEPSEAEGKDE